MTLTLRPQTPRTEGARRYLTDTPKRLLIDGDWIAASDTFEARDPATGTLLAHLARADGSHATAAVTAAEHALHRDDWARMLPSARGALLWRIADLIEANADELAELETLDQGKTLATGRMGEIPGAIAQFRYYAGYATKITGETITPSIGYAPPGKRVTAHTRREPIGVVVAITPWNSPLLMAAMKLAPALCAGCTVVLKPAEETSLTAIRLAELMVEAKVPPGVVNVLTGYGEEVGAALTAHPGVAKVAFTGSTQVGRILLGAARGNLKKLTLELGGKSPALVLPDADMGLAVPGIARGIFANGGQVCVAGSRVYAHRSVADQLTEGLAKAAGAMRLGHGLDPEVDLGPLINPEQADRVATYLSDGAADGAEIVTGGARFDEGRAFLSPAVVTGVRPDMRMMQEEIFGPIVAITPYDDLDEAVAMANDTDYGLAASVWTENLSSAHRVSDAVRAGTVWVNCHSYFAPELPKGGMKQSGWGVENGAQGLENYLETKTICMVV